MLRISHDISNRTLIDRKPECNLLWFPRVDAFCGYIDKLVPAKSYRKAGPAELSLMLLPASSGTSGLQRPNSPTPNPTHNLIHQEYKKGDLTQNALASFGLNTLPDFNSQEDIYILRIPNSQTGGNN
jgi:hypothetical protein